MGGGGGTPRFLNGNQTTSVQRRTVGLLSLDGGTADYDIKTHALCEGEGEEQERRGDGTTSSVLKLDSEAKINGKK